MNDREREVERRQLAERVRAAMVEVAAAGWEDAAVSGLCGDGAFEAAIGRMRSLDLAPLLEPGAQSPESG